MESEGVVGFAHQSGIHCFQLLEFHIKRFIRISFRQSKVVLKVSGFGGKQSAVKCCQIFRQHLHEAEETFATAGFHHRTVSSVSTSRAGSWVRTQRPKPAA